LPASLIHVAAAAIADEAGRILLTRRADHVHQGGLWEFPGGKLEAAESPEAALARELHEELGIRVEASEPLIRVRHDYGDRRVLLDVHRVVRYAGQPQGREGQPLRWVHPDAMRADELPAADRPIVLALRLPDRYLITGADPSQRGVFLGRLRQALAAGLRLVQLRAPGLDPGRYRELALESFALCAAQGACLVLNTSPTLARTLPHGGLHLTATRLRTLGRRPPGIRGWVGASCHDATELAHAEWLGLDYALLSPVCPTASHPGAKPLGWEGFAELVDAVGIPVLALGGLFPADLPEAKRHGAQGIAAIRGFWPTPERTPQ
jgi:8-oxo-dGTP diphosphatase